jgi:hypothetical protein
MVRIPPWSLSLAVEVQRQGLLTSYMTSLEDETERRRLAFSLSTRAAYHSNLDRHFVPFFGQPRDGADPAVERSGVGDIATAQGLAPRSVRKYHVTPPEEFDQLIRAVPERIG